uniref:Ly49-like N-terminal domain-containing protein n=1 Tax=Ursus americanus TaxID=9643 RepID=A0A452QEQ6_URSAM
MSNEQVIYSTLRFLRSPSESPNRLRPGGTQRPGKTDDTVFQYIQENHQQREEIGNLTREHHILQNESYLKERLLTNKTLEYNILKNESLQQKKEQDLLFSDRTYQRENEAIKILFNFGGLISKLCENRLSYRGIKYYYFIPESQNWNGCKQTCQSYNSSLLKINDEDELVSWTVTFAFIFLTMSHAWTQEIEDKGRPERGTFRDLDIQIMQQIQIA